MAPDANFPWGKIHIPPGWQKPCSAKQWNDGVLAVSSIAAPNILGLTTEFDDVPVGLAPDGVGGAFVLTVCDLYVPSALGPYASRHIGPTGVRSNLVTYDPLLSWIGVLGPWAEGAIVPSGSKRCIVVWARDWQTWDIKAQRYDETLTPLWQNGTPVKANGTYKSPQGKNSLIAEPDGNEGVIVAWIEGDYSGADYEVRMQRLDSNGDRLWGRDGILFGSISVVQSLLDFPWLQLVGNGKGGGIVIVPENTGSTVQLTAYDLDKNGNLNGAPTPLVAVARNTWTAVYRLRRAVPDGVGGLYLAYTNMQGILRALRYSSAGTVSWDIQIGTPMNPGAYSIREDDRGGFLLAFVSNNPFQKAELMRIDANGNITWNINSASGNVPLFIILPAGSANWTNDDWSRFLQAVPDANGGALLVHQNQDSGSVKLFTSCFDKTGTQVSPTQRVTARQTSQELPVVISGGGTSAIVSWSDDERASTHGLDVWTQRVGCCIPEPIGEIPYPRFGCEIIQFSEGSHFREMILQFPCGNRDLQWGVIPLTRFFASIRGLDYPGSIFNRDVESPDWIRINFLGLPQGSKVQFYSLKGELIADGKMSKGESKQDLVQTTLTFKPSDEDHLIVFTNNNTVERGSRLPVRVSSDWGNGKPTELLQRKQLRAKTKRSSSSRKSTRRRSN